ncbi:MAG: zinc ribbon domain-containing protein [Chloroflexota bacterium]|nr:zinc ribbon domain-containing protein [Chloroflexota bacterium]
MPIYEYRCTDCGSHVEALVRANDDAPRCPECDSVLHEKLLSAPNVLSGRTTRQPGHTCCGQEERCEAPPCSGGEGCHKR